MIGDYLDIVIALPEKFDNQEVVVWDETAELFLAAAALGLEGRDGLRCANLWTMIVNAQAKIELIKERR